MDPIVTRIRESACMSMINGNGNGTSYEKANTVLGRRTGAGNGPHAIYVCMRYARAFA